MDDKKRRKPVDEVFDSTFQLRINREDKAEYLAACETLGLDHNTLIRNFMKKIAATNTNALAGISGEKE